MRLLIGEETDNVEEVEKDYLAFDAKIHPESMHISPKTQLQRHRS